MRTTDALLAFIVVLLITALVTATRVDAADWQAPASVPMPALQPPPPDIGEFVAYCTFSHRAHDDPIVFPGQPGKSHSHDFFGSVVADADVTVDEMLAGDTTCDPIGDRSSYWVPTLFDPDGTPVPTEQETFYYLINVDDTESIQPYPPGLKIIAGNAAAAGPEENDHYKWSCLGSGVSSTEHIVECPQGSKLELLLNFPDCWDGEHVDSADHKSHMAYSEGGACPPGHPVPVPALQYKLRYDTRGGADFRLAPERGMPGPGGYRAHGDFFNAWESPALINRIFCLRHEVKCDEAGYIWGSEIYLPATLQ